MSVVASGTVDTHRFYKYARKHDRHESPLNRAQIYSSLTLVQLSINRSVWWNATLIDEMATSPSAALAALQATTLTRRCHNPYFRREQLKALHDALRIKSQILCNAIKQDTDVTDSEASIEVAAVLRILKEHHAEIDPKQELEEEYRISKGRDARDRTNPWGIIYLEPKWIHTPLFSLLGALSAAIAAGNCILLRSDTFQIVSSSPSAGELAKCLCVLQATSLQIPTHAQLVSPAGRVIAVVDRSADVASAAASLVTARFAFGGTSPYAPDLVLVNEFVREAFIEQVLRKVVLFTAKASTSPSNEKSAVSLNTSRLNVQKDLTALKEHEDWKLDIISSTDSGAIIELTNPHTTHIALPRKPTAPILCISAVSSLDHAIDLVATHTNDHPLIAAYHFSAPSHAKYLSQFICANISFANHIPPQLFLGPSAPPFHAINIERKYKREHFVRASPVFLGPIKPAVPIGLMKSSSQDASQLLQEASAEIQEAKRAEWIAHGFFEQGIFIGLGMYGAPLVACLAASMFFGVRMSLKALY
ncbi:hypothetical protein N0V90_013096 [Kalmusia sp. IMI 367209]|nr:hypothetical protein N0V90_013096 [Kalmusia sp. IMI 367209]